MWLWCCPFCRGAYRDVHRMLDLYPGSIRFAFRNFPIQQLHPHAEQAAEAAEAAAAQGKFWEAYDALLALTGDQVDVFDHDHRWLQEAREPEVLANQSDLFCCNKQGGVLGQL